jgi:hypothetical protein
MVVKRPFLSVANFGLQSLDIIEALYFILLHFYLGYFSTVSDRNSAVSFAYAITLPFSLTICKSKSITPVSNFKPPEELSFPQKVFRSSSINLTSTQKFFNDSPGKKSCCKASKIMFFLEGYQKSSFEKSCKFANPRPLSL